MKQQYNKLQFIKDKQINETTKQQQLIILYIKNKLRNQMGKTKKNSQEKFMLLKEHPRKNS